MFTVYYYMSYCNLSLNGKSMDYAPEYSIGKFKILHYHGASIFLRKIEMRIKQGHLIDL